MTVENAVDAGTPRVLASTATIVDALDGLTLPDSDRSIDAQLVAKPAISDRVRAGDADCIVLTPADPLDPLDAASTIAVVLYAPRDDVDDDRLEAIATTDGVDYVPADADTPTHALLASAVRGRVAATRTRADRDLRAAAMDQAVVGITIADADHPDEALVYANQGFETVTGYPPERAVGRNCRFLQGDATDEANVAELRAAIDADDPTTVELRNYTECGDAFWNRVTVTPIRNADGRVTHYVGIQDDVTAEKEAQTYERRLVEITTDRSRDFEQKLDAVLELGLDRFDVDVGFLAKIDDDFEVVAAKSEHPGLQPGEHSPLSQTYCRRTIDAEEPLVVENASEEWAEDPAYERWGLECYVGTKIEVDDERYGTLCFADTSTGREFTAAESTFVDLVATWVRLELERQRRNRRLERKNERLASFASVVSHDLRNPLALAQGHLESLRASDADPDAVDGIAHGLDRMAQLIDDVLTLARDGEVVDDPERVAPAAVATEAWRVVDGDADLVVRSDLPVIEADPERLRTVFENLFRNAIGHGDATEITVDVDADGRLTVGDDGTGIPESDRDTVFEHGYTTDESGTGFGLAIVGEIADAHGWTVTVEESDAGGARFAFDGVEMDGE